MPKVIIAYIKIFMVSVFILKSYILFSQTTISGGAVSGTWTQANSPYLIAGSIYIPDGSTLTIDPGAVVNFQNTYKLLVLGRLIAVGTTADSITFTSQDTTVGWRGIKFDNTPATNDTSKILFCKFLYAKNAGAGEYPVAIHLDTVSKVIIKNNLISHCAAAIRVYYSNPIIQYNTIKYNIGFSCVNLYNSNFQFKYNVVVSNSLTSTSTGAIHAQDFNGKISNNIIKYNSVQNNYGGGIVLYNGNTVVDSNEISNNNSSGIFKNWYSNQTISNNIIANNLKNGIEGFASNISQNVIVGNNKGLISWQSGSCPSSQVLIERNIIANNTMVGLDLCSNVFYVSNNLIINNGSSASIGGAIYCKNASSTFINNTIANNLALKGGALYCENNSDPSFTNNIMWGNVANNGPQIFLYDENSDPSFYYCDIEGGQPGIDANFNIYMGAFQNNINSNPQFLQPSLGAGISYSGTNADWQIMSASPCVDAGDPNGTYPPTDFLGNPRIAGSYIDIGAYESTSISQSNQSIFGSHSGNTFTIFPNPNNGSFAVIQYESRQSEFKIYNILGEIVYSKQLIINNDRVITDLPKGIYFVQLTTEKSVFNKKMAVE